MTTTTLSYILCELDPLSLGTNTDTIFDTSKYQAEAKTILSSISSGLNLIDAISTTFTKLGVSSRIIAQIASCYTAIKWENDPSLLD